METTLPGESIAELCKEPFLQADELIPVYRDIPHDSLQQGTLATWLEAAMLVQKNTTCNALSFNQLNSKLLMKLGFGGSVPPSIIYLHTSDRGNSILLINPRVSYSAAAPTYASLEGCGSIDYGNMGYVVTRPSQFALQGHVYDGKRVYQVDAQDSLLTRLAYPNAVHEDRHLRHGQTALDQPDLLWDITQRSVWQRFIEWNNFHSESSWMRILAEQSKHGVIIPAGRDEYKVVGLDEIGKY